MTTIIKTILFTLACACAPKSQYYVEASSNNGNDVMQITVEANSKGTFLMSVNIK